MIDLFFLFFFFLLGSVLLILGVLRVQYSFVIFSGLLFILMGLFVFNGIDYINGYTAFQNGSTTTINYVYSVYGGSFNTATGFILCFFGLGLLLLSAFMIFNSRRKTLEMVEEETI